MNCKEYATNLLEKCGCPLDCYRDISFEVTVKDLITYYNDENIESPYPIAEIAKYLKEIADEQPMPVIKKAPYRMVFDMGHTIDGIYCESFESAKANMEDTYIQWICDETYNWKFADDGTPMPTEEQREAFNYMIYECCCWAAKLDEETGEYEDLDNAYTLPEDELEALGWKEI